MCCASISAVASRLAIGRCQWVIFLTVTVLLSLPRNGYALNQHDYLEFVQINAVKSLDDGGFAIVGLLRSGPGPTKSGFLRLSSSGDPVGQVVELPTPTDHTEVVATGLERLPGGDLVVCGWALKERSDTDFWLARINPNGKVAWQWVSNSKLQEKLYEVKQLADGKLLAVGRSQLGEKDKPSHGAAVWLDADTGKLVKQEIADCPDARQRCGFQDVTELSNGGLIFAGWITKKSDDIWLLKASEEGKPIKSVIFGNSGNDVAFAIASLDDSVLVAGTTRDGKSTQTAVLIRFDAALAKKTPIEILQANSGQARAIESLGLAKRFVIAGVITDNSTSKAFSANLPSDSTKAEVTDVASPESQFSSVASDGQGNVAMAGWAGTGGGRHGILGFRSGGVLCSADSTISTLAIDHPEDRLETGCAVAGKPARFKLTASQPDAVIVVRPTAGDIDAFLVSGETITDSSLNTKRAPEILILPVETNDLELSIASTTPVAAFELSVATVSAPKVERAAKPSSGEEEDTETVDDALPADNADASAASANKEEDDETADSDEADETSDDEAEASQDETEGAAHAAAGSSFEEARLTAFALRSLGYDVSGEPAELDETVQTFDKRAILAFQAAAGFPLTGQLQDSERVLLLQNAAKEVDALAQQAAATARGIAAASPLIPFTEDDAKLNSLAGGMAQSGTYAVGHYKNGSEFSGLWQGDLNDDPLPRLGVLQITKDCSFAFGMAEGFDASSDVDQPAVGALGVIRNHGSITVDGDFNGRRPSTDCGGEG